MKMNSKKKSYDNNLLAFPYRVWSKSGRKSLRIAAALTDGHASINRLLTNQCLPWNLTKNPLHDYEQQETRQWKLWFEAERSVSWVAFEFLTTVFMNIAILRDIVHMCTNVSEGHITSGFRVENRRA
jgi:hypothetical protein